MLYPKIHPDKEINNLFLHLCDRLSMRERDTGRQSVLIFREVGGTCVLAVDGVRAHAPEYASDEMLLGIVKSLEPGANAAAGEEEG